MKQNLNIAAAIILLSIFCAVCARGETAPQVNINDATLEQLAYLPGVGAAKAQAIVDARPYAAIDELTRAKGIGDKTLAKLAPYLTANDKTTAASKIKLPADPIVITTDSDVSVKVTCDDSGCTVRLTGSGLDSDSITVRTRG